MKSNKSETQIGDVVAHIERDLSREETVRYFADAFREYGGTDLCLMLPGGMADGQMHPYGISGKLYEGELHANELTVLLPNAGKPVPTLATARISGEDLRAVLESGRTFERKEGNRTPESSQAARSSECRQCKLSAQKESYPQRAQRRSGPLLPASS